MNSISTYIIRIKEEIVESENLISKLDEEGSDESQNRELFERTHDSHDGHMVKCREC
jgi:hypothetical protein